MILNLYLSKKLIYYFCVIFLVFFCFLTILSWIDILRLELPPKISSAKLFYLAILKTPTIVHPLIPIITLLTSLCFFTNISRNSELVIIRSAGRSIIRTILIPVSTIFAIGLFLVLIINPINTIALKLYNSELSLVNKYTSNFSINDTGVWLREGSSSGQRVVHAQSVIDQGGKLKNVSIFEFNKFSIPIARISSKLVFISENRWDLKDGKIWKVNRIDRPEDRAKSFQSMWLDTELSLDKIKLGYGEPSKISFWELQSYIKRIERAGFSSLKHKVYLHKEIALPLLMVGMFLIGGALNMGHSRLGKKSFAVLVTILMGLSGFLLNNLTEILGENEAIPYLFDAWAPPIIIIFIATGLILHLEDG